MHSRHVLLVLGLLAIAAPAAGAIATVEMQARADTNASIEALAYNSSLSVEPILLAVDSSEPGDAGAAAESAGPLVDAGEPTQIAGAVVGTVVGAALLAAFWAPIKGLALTLLAPLFSRIDRSSVLDLEARHRVHDVVVHNPGITIKEVATLCGLGWGTTVYHLERLEGERVLVSQRQRQFRRYFVYGGSVANDAKTAYGELLAPMARRLAELIQSTPGRCQKELCESLQIRPSLAHKHLSRLMEAGLLSAEREWKLVRYYPTAQLAGMLPMLTNPLTTAALSAPAAA